MQFTLGLTACSTEKESASKDADDDDGGKKKKKKKKKKKTGKKKKSDEDEEGDADTTSEDDGDVAPNGDPPEAAAWKVGDAVDVEWKRQWWKATILSVEGEGKYKIHYVGWSSSWDETVPASRVRARTATAKEGSQKEASNNPGGSNDTLPQADPAPAVPTPAPGKEAGPFVGKGGKPPSTEEWTAQTKEVVVHGSTARGCETKMVRGWLRVSCRGEPKGYGKPASVSIARGGNSARHFEFANAAVTSLVVRFEPGVDMDVDFGWTRKRSRLHVFWPRSSPEPAYKGKFEDV